MIDDLLRIKNLRESRAQLALMRERVVFAKSLQARDEAKRTWEHQCKEAHTREIALFGAMIGGLRRVREIEDTRWEVQSMRQESDRLGGLARQAASALTQAQKKLDDVRDTTRRAERAKEKFVDLAHRYTGIAAREAQRLEDLEMEEAAAQGRDGADRADREAQAEWNADHLAGD
ncbi:YscO family type III secretion system apparatus protein [Robbsia sp. KACC 23696]|uniref:type III secretion system stalk subunit SctO n=1 Tax=Robbsia sp. KACC 23696 TaxID=3149231 RepID=UPI00325B0DC8